VERLEDRALRAGFTEYPIPTGASAPQGITVGSDNALWFTETAANKIGRITTAGLFTEFPIPTAASAPWEITSGPDGALWFTESSGNQIGRITTAGVITEFPVPTANSNPQGITTGPDGALWFTEFSNPANKIGRVSTSGAFTEFPIQVANSGPREIVTGPDGALWFTEFTGDQIGRFTTTGVYAEKPVSPNRHPRGITVGPDGALWFTEFNGQGNDIGRITTSMALTETPVPTPAANPLGIVTGADGTLYFTENAVNDVGSVTTSGSFTETAIPTAISSPWGITSGPDKAIWFTENAGNKIGRLAIPGPIGTISVTGQSVNAVEGAMFTGLVATFSDSNQTGLGNDVATITWGDGATSPGTVGFDSATGRYTVSGIHTYAEDGGYPTSVKVNATGGVVGTGAGSATVTDATVTLSASPVSAVEGATFSGAVATFTDANPAASPADFSATIDWGDGTTSAGNVVYNSASGRFTVNGSHAYAEEGSFAVATTCSENGGVLGTVTGTATLADAALAVSVAPVTAGLGLPWSGTVASFVDADPGAAPADFAATIDWGDGTTSAGTVAYDSTSARFTVAGTHTYLVPGSPTLTVTVNDAGGSVGSGSGPASVPVPLILVSAVPVSAVEGNPFSTTVASFTDPNPADTASNISATIAWGDGTTSAGTVAYDPVAARYTVTGSHAYSEEGSPAFTVTVRGALTRSSASASATVSDAPLSAGVVSISPTEGKPLTGVVATFSDANPSATATDFSAAIAWGDGQSSAGTVAFDAASGRYTVTGSHTYAEEGSVLVSVTVRDTGGTTVTASGSVVVDDAPLSSQARDVAAVEGTPFSGTLAGFSDADPSATAGDFLASIDWGDGTSSAGSVAADGLGGFRVSGAHTYAEEGNYTVALKVSDAGGATARATGTATVDDAPLSVSSLPARAVEGSAYSGVIATFADADPGAVAADFTASVDWGDGTTGTGVVAFDGSSGRFTVTGSHTYAEEGSYPVALTVTDSGGASASATATALASDAPLSASLLPLGLSEGASFSGAVASFADADPGGLVSDFSATIDWGDGTTTAGVVSFDAVSGRFRVDGSHVYQAQGVAAVRVVIADAGGAGAEATGPVTVGPSLLKASPSPVSSTEAVAFSGAVATFTDSNPAALAADFSASIDWGDGQSSGGSVGYDPVTGVFSVSGSHTYAADGSYPLRVSISGRDGKADLPGSATVAETPVAASGGPVAATAGLPFRGIVATFPGDAPATGDRYTASITWGDGQSSSGLVTLDVVRGVYVVEGSNVYAIEGVYPVRVSIHLDGAGDALGATTATAVVSDAALTAAAVPVSATAGAPFTGVVAAFTDADPAGDLPSYAATITWGDGHTSPGTIGFDPASRAFTVAGTNTYAVEGVYAISVDIHDRGGAGATAAGPAVVRDAPLVPAVVPVAVTAGEPFAGAVAAFTDADATARPADFLASIVWGDGVTTPGTVTADGPGRFVVSGTHTFTHPGPLRGLVTVDDRGGSHISVAVDLAVAPAPPGGGPPPPVVVPPLGKAPAQVSGAPTPPIAIPVYAGPAAPAAPGGQSAVTPENGGGVGAPVTIARGALVSIAAPAAPAGPGTSAHPGAIPAAPARGGPETVSRTEEAVATLQASLDRAVAYLTPRIAGLFGGTPGAGGTYDARTSLQPRDRTQARTPPADYDAPSEGFWAELDEFGRQVSTGTVPERAAIVLGSGVVAYVGHVLLNGRWGYALLSLLTARPLWGQLDPLDVLNDWEREKKSRTGTRREAGEGEDDESLQSLVARGRDGDRDDGTTDDDANQPGAHESDRQHPVRRPRPRAHPRQRGRRTQGAKGLV